MTEFGLITQVGEKQISSVSHVPILRGGSHRPYNFGTPYICQNGLTYRTTKQLHRSQRRPRRQNYFYTRFLVTRKRFRCCFLLLLCDCCFVSETDRKIKYGVFSGAWRKQNVLRVFFCWSNSQTPECPHYRAVCAKSSGN